MLIENCSLKLIWMIIRAEGFLGYTTLYRHEVNKLWQNLLIVAIRGDCSAINFTAMIIVNSQSEHANSMVLWGETHRE